MPRSFIPGRIPVSNSRFELITRLAVGRINAIKVAAAACIPIVPENKSTLSPIKNALNKSSHFGVSNGSKRINIT